jgi:HTH-type transcriptional regulator/antitoxin HigA
MSSQVPDRQQENSMKNNVRLIKTEAEYETALTRLSDLMDKDIKAGSNLEDELDLLALVIREYERSKVAAPIADPIEAILFRMDQQGLQKKDLVPYFGSLPKVSEVLSRKRPLTLAMIRKLHTGLGIAAETLLLGDDGINLSDAPAYDHTKFPLQEMFKRGYFKPTFDTIRKVKDHAEEAIREFMQNSHLQPARLRAPLHQKGVRTMDEYALLAWRVAVLKKARGLKLTREYVDGSISDAWLSDLAKLSRFDQGPRLAQEFLADAGIALVFEDHFEKTYLDGAAMLDGSRPVVALTLRHDRLDNFWFALMHELVHVQKHLRSDNDFIADNLEDKIQMQTRDEQEADEGAKHALIDPEEWENSAVRLEHNTENAKALADKLRIHPVIVAGRVRHDTGNWRLLSNIKATVRQHFESAGVTA